ncbi:MAG TPA: hypothetical protein PKC91_08215 [Ignavibacteria bacterium]|nr:hypothetical protein [Ignavibacteria bacterium]
MKKLPFNPRLSRVSPSQHFKDRKISPGGLCVEAPSQAESPH